MIQDISMPRFLYQNLAFHIFSLYGLRLNFQGSDGNRKLYRQIVHSSRENIINAKNKHIRFLVAVVLN